MILILVKLLKKNLWSILICQLFRVIYDMMTVIMAVTAGQYLMEKTSEFVARTFARTKQRSLSLCFFNMSLVLELCFSDSTKMSSGACKVVHFKWMV